MAVKPRKALKVLPPRRAARGPFAPGSEVVPTAAVGPVRLRIVVVTGLSGSGKSTATRALEDVGYFCIDNLPVVLLPKMTELAAAAGAEIRHLALVIDAREGRFLTDAPRAIEEARRSGYPVEVLFLDSSEEALIRRFSETRRRHPLSGAQGTVIDGIALERQRLGDLRSIADQVIDTTHLTGHELKSLLQSRFAPSPQAGPALTVLSFGYRYGIPPHADLVFDVRFLPNPFYVEGMKARTGIDQDVAEFVLSRPEAQTFLEKTSDLCAFLLPQYQREGKAYLTVALGCTGGKHRSVAMARALAERLAKGGGRVQVWDRDIEKE